MLTIRQWILAGFLVACLGYSPLLAQQTISGDLSGALGPGEFLVVGDCNIPQGETLVIQPGTTLLFSGHYAFNVYGQLNAEGTESDSIKFLRQYPIEEYKHGGIRIQPGASTENTIIYCRIDYADNPDFPDCWGGGIFCYDAGATVANCTITNCRALFGAGIYVIGSTATVSECTITDCYAIAEGGAIYSVYSSIVVSDCVIMNNTADQVAGIHIYTDEDAEVRNCIVADNTATSSAA